MLYDMRASSPRFEFEINLLCPNLVGMSLKLQKTCTWSGILERHAKTFSGYMSPRKRSVNYLTTVVTRATPHELLLSCSSAQLLTRAPDEIAIPTPHQKNESVRRKVVNNGGLLDQSSIEIIGSWFGQWGHKL